MDGDLDLYIAALYCCVNMYSCARTHVSPWLQIKYQRMHLESSSVYKEQLKEFYEKYPDAKELLKRYMCSYKSCGIQDFMMTVLCFVENEKGRTQVQEEGKL